MSGPGGAAPAGAAPAISVTITAPAEETRQIVRSFVRRVLRSEVTEGAVDPELTRDVAVAIAELAASISDEAPVEIRLYCDDASLTTTFIDAADRFDATGDDSAVVAAVATDGPTAIGADIRCTFLLHAPSPSSRSHGHP